jgi:hypothetical protein
MSRKYRTAGSRAFFTALLGMLSFVAAGQAQEPQFPGFKPTPPRTSSSAGKQPGPKSAANSGIESLNLPPGAVIVICDDPKEAARLTPRAIVLTPEEYARLLEKSEQSKRDKSDSKLEIPSVCRISGQIDGNLARIRATYEFATSKADALVNLGCQKAWPTAVSLDGQLPALQAGDDGFVLRVPRSGSHQAALDVVVPVSPRRDARGNDRGFELDLPRAAISVLDSFEFPGKISEVRMGTRLLHTKQPASSSNRIGGVPIVPIDRLDLGWKDASSDSANAMPILTADTRVLVRVTENQIVTDAELTLQPLGGITAQWRLRVPVPPAAEVEVKAMPPDDPRVRSIKSVGSDGADQTWVVQLKEPSAERLQIRVRLRQRRTTELVSIGPFTVSAAQIQKGEIEVHAVEDVRVRYIPCAEVSRREVSEDQRRNGVRAGFAYWSLPSATSSASASPALLQLQVEPLKGTAEARVVHTLKWSDNAPLRQPTLRLTTRLEINPVRTRVDRVQISLPAGFVYSEAVGPRPVDLVEDFVVDTQNHSGQFRLTQKQDRPFTLTIEGSYAVNSEEGALTIGLPRPTACAFEKSFALDAVAPSVVVQFPVLDRGGQVNVILPEDKELLGDRFQSVIARALAGGLPPFLMPPRPRLGNHEYSWQTERMPEKVELAWRPHIPDITADSVVDVTLSAKAVRVVQEMRLRAASGTPARAELAVPLEIRQRLHMLSGSTVADPERGKAGWSVHWAEGQQMTVLMEYDLDREADASSFAMPFVGLMGAAHHEIKVRVWSDSLFDIRLQGAGWEEKPTEVVVGHDRLPACVGYSASPRPLVLRVAENRERLARPSTIVDRVLGEVVIRENGIQSYRIRFLLGQLAGSTLPLELPIALTPDNLDVRLDDKRLPVKIVDESGEEVRAGRFARAYRDPRTPRSAQVLSIEYQCDATRIPGNGFFQGAVAPPILADAICLGRTRWQLFFPEGLMPILAGGTCRGEWAWSWQNGLLRPYPAATAAELDGWLLGREADAQAELGEPSLLCWQPDLAPISFWQVSKRQWLLLCSVPFLAYGLVLIFVPLGRFAFWGSLLVAALGVGAATYHYPGVLPALAFGCEPGLAILAVMVGTHLVFLRSQRGRVAFAPGFSRAKTGSALVAASNGNPPREPSTVDLPPKRGSSVSSEIPA